MPCRFQSLHDKRRKAKMPITGEPIAAHHKMVATKDRCSGRFPSKMLAMKPEKRYNITRAVRPKAVV